MDIESEASVGIGNRLEHSNIGFMEDENNIEQFLPDWQLIDEISIKLLEQGVGTFETLQRALPSVVLAQIEQILPDAEDNVAKSPVGKDCSGMRLLKLFRLAQLQIEYLMKTQQGLMERMERVERRAKDLRKENRILREEMLKEDEGMGAGEQPIEVEEQQQAKGPQWGRELFRCNECSKLFLHLNFLTDHIVRKHSGQIEGKVRAKAERVLGMGRDETERAKSSGSSSRRTESKKIQRGYSQESAGTLRKRTDVRSATGTFSTHHQQHKYKQFGPAKLGAEQRDRQHLQNPKRPVSSENISFGWP